MSNYITHHRLFKGNILQEVMIDLRIKAVKGKVALLLKKQKVSLNEVGLVLHRIEQAKAELMALDFKNEFELKGK